jgi:TM2 domain-containing membrane protein YozV
MSNQSGSAYWTCPQCGGMGSIYDARCPQCGAARNAPTVNLTATTQPLAPLVSSVSAGVQRLTSQTCVQCGTANSLFALRCQQCGNMLTSVRTSTTPRRRGVAAALAFFGGVIGAQYFYMGRRILGGACVALCWTGYPAVVGFLETFRILAMSDAEFAQQCEG